MGDTIARSPHGARQDVPTCDPHDTIWQAIRAEAFDDAEREPVLASFLHSTILKHATFEEALSFHLANKLASESLPAMLIREIIDEAVAKAPEIGRAVRADLRGVRDRDPACAHYSTPLLYYKGMHALEAYRVAHWLWGQGRWALARCFQNRIAERFGVDIHPAARIGSGVFIDHGTGVVVGETAVIEDDVSMLQQVTLGGTGKETGDRHPKVRAGVLLGASATVLGNVEVGAGAKVGAGSVVLSDVPAGCTVAGVPARVVGHCAGEFPALAMDHRLPDAADRPDGRPAPGAFGYDAPDRRPGAIEEGAMIEVGDKIPHAKVKIATSSGIKDATTEELFGGKKVVLFGLPGAFTPTCSAKHLPGFVQNAAALKAKGVDAIVCLSVNDAFVMDAWGKAQNVGDDVVMLADGGAELTRALGLDFDATQFGMGVRSQRYAAVIEDGVVRLLNVEKPMKFEVSNAETILSAL